LDDGLTNPSRRLRPVIEGDIGNKIRRFNDDRPTVVKSADVHHG